MMNNSYRSIKNFFFFRASNKFTLFIKQKIYLKIKIFVLAKNLFSFNTMKKENDKFCWRKNQLQKTALV